MQVLEKYEKFTNDLLKKHNLLDWKFVWNNRASTRTLGICKYSSKQIHLNKKYALVESEENVIDTIVHEIAHALTKGHGHGEVWKAKCRELGCRDEQYKRLDKNSVKRLAKYKAVCPTCGHEVFGGRKTSIVHISCSNKEYRETGKTDWRNHIYVWSVNE
jgi:predicted SprT family Zn-dependent metalloprotease